MVRRYAEEGWAATPRVLLETGGAVILCSLTTIWGYLSLLSSDNQALRSFGKLAALGELTCLTAAVLVLPGLATLSSRRRSR
jgi:predicted RND superfamily exporter protein